jgi:predicted MFS family arabinose efflux permease
MLTDRVGSRRVLLTALPLLVGIFAVLSLAGGLFSPEVARWAVVPLIAVWGFVGYSFLPAQQAHIAALAPNLAAITLSLNASAIYLGASLGALLGSVAIAHGPVYHLGWVAAACEVGALLILRSLLAVRRPARRGTDANMARVTVPQS